MYRTLNLVLVLAICGWTSVALGSLLYHARDAKRHIQHIAHETATESIQKDLLYRYWAAQHGGVYVPVAGSTPPNPYLDFVQERDITTPSGRRLTLLNPAYMTRQVHELGRTFDEVQAHITSLKPLRPENAPDPWEARALRTIEQGAKEFGEVVEFQGAPHYRLMQPLYADKPCLTCHAAQGYRQGDLRGGISASVPMSLFSDVSRDHMTSEAKHFGGIWVLGLAGMTMANVFVRRRIREREAAVHAVEESEQRLRSVVDNAPFGAHLYHLEPDGRLIFTGANDAANRILGIDHSSFAGKTIEEAFPALPENVCSEYRSVAMTGEAHEFEHIAYDEGTIRGVFDVHAVQVAQMQVGVFFRDITDKHRAEAAIRASEERFRTIVSTAREGIISIDAQENVSYVNGQMATMLGYRPEEMIGRPIRVFVHPDEREDHARQIDLRRKGLATQYERRYLHRDGDVVRTLVSASPLLGEDDAFAGAFGMVTDITAQAEMQEQLATSERQLRTIFDTLQAGVLLVDPSGTITFANRRMAEMFKCPLERVIGTAYPEHVHPDHRSVGDTKMHQLIAGEIDSVILECRYIAADGSDFWGYLSARRLEDEKGRLVSLVGIIADITERQRAEDELRRSREQYRLLAESAHAITWEYDIEKDRWTYVSPQAEQILGFGPDAWTNLAWWVGQIHPDDRKWASAFCAKATARGEDHTLEYRFIAVDGRPVWLYDTVHVERRAGTPAVMRGVMIDITERKFAEEELRTSQEYLAKAQRIAEFGIWEWEIATNKLNWNREVFELYGFDPAGGTPSFDVVLSTLLPEYREAFPEAIRRTLDENVPFEGEYAIRRQDGEIRYTHTAGEVTRDQSGRPVRMFGIVQDITTRKKMELTLQESETRLKQAQQLGRIGNWDRDVVNDRLWWSDEVYRIFAIEPGKPITYDVFLARIHPEDRDRVRMSIQEANEKAKKVWHIEYRVQLPDGTVRNVHESAKADLGPDGKVVRRRGIVQDITERYEAEEALRRSEEFTRTIIENEPECVKILGPGGVLQYMNAAGLAMIEADSLEMVQGRSVYPIVVPEHRDAFAELTERVFRGEGGMLEFEMVGLRGTRRWLETHAVSLRDESGTVDRLLGITRDVTARKRAEQELWESQTRLDVAVRGAKLGIWQWDVLTGKRTFDEYTCSLLGLDPQAFSGSAEEFFAAIHPEDQKHVKDALARTLETDAPYEPEYRTVHPGGQIRYLAARGVLIRDNAGRPLRLTGVLSDITERKQRENDLREIAETLAAKTGGDYYNAMTELISRSLGMEYVLIGELETEQHAVKTLSLYWQNGHAKNRTYALAGTPCDNVTGKRLCSYLRDTQRLFPYDTMLADLKIESYLGTPLFGKNGRPLGIIAALGTKALEADTVTRGETLLTIMAARASAELERTIDNELRLSLESQLHQARKIEAVGRLAGGVAHDINNMLTPILGYADMLGLRIPDGDPSRSDLDEIVTAANRVKDMTQQLLAFARKQTLDMRPVDANVVISRFSKMLHRTLREDVSITLNLAASVGNVQADERQLELVVLNLALNAQDAMKGGGRLTISTQDIIVDEFFAETRQGMSPGRYLELRIQDSGEGMDASTRSQIFEPFFTTKEKGKGTGLGLATVYGIVKQHKGYIEVLSERGLGTTFVIYLPVIDAATDQEQSKAPASVRRGYETVLVVEDQADVLKIVKQLLEALGYKVLTALNSEAADEIMRTNRSAVDLLLTDVIMPGTNGKELYERLRAGYPRLKVLYMSGYPADVISTHGVLDKSVHFLRKPFSVQDLSHQVREALDHPVAGTA